MLRYSAWPLYEYCSPGYEQIFSTGALGNGEEILDCAKCAKGSYSNIKNALHCTSCPDGTYTSADGETECIDCAANFYQPLIGSTTCLECPFGKTSAAASGLCTSCEFVFMLSRHCDIPIMGILIGIASVMRF